MKTLIEIKSDLKSILPDGVDLFLHAIKKILPSSSPRFNDMVQLESRYREVNVEMLNDIISADDAKLKMNQLRRDILTFIDILEETDFKTADAKVHADGTPDVYNGEVLYRIPHTMEVGSNVKCIVRVAFDRVTLMQDLELEKGDVMKDVRISDVMGVELLDPSGNKAFVISTNHDVVQFIEKEIPTEWIFRVTPILEGKHPLVLKISVIEILNGVERKRNVVLEEEVQIVSKITEPVGAEVFERSGQMLQMGSANVAPQGDRGIPPGAPYAPSSTAPGGGGSAPTTPSPSAMPPRSSGNMRKVMGTLGALLALVIASIAMFKALGPEVKPPDRGAIAEADNNKRDWDSARNMGTASAMQKYIKENPKSAYLSSAKSMLDSLDNSAWTAALASNDTAYYKEYLETYTASAMHAAEAEAYLKRAREEAELAQKEKQPTPPVNPGNTGTNKPPKKTGTTTKPPKKTNPNTPKNDPPKTDTSKNDAPKNDPPKTDPPPKKEDPNKVVLEALAAKKPIFKDCDKDYKDAVDECTKNRIRKFIKEGLKYPADARRKNIEGFVKMTFVVEKDGSISGVTALNELGGGCTKEAIRLLSGLPKFKPGLNENGKPIRVRYNLNIDFKLSD